jgi:hypothetical protein
MDRGKEPVMPKNKYGLTFKGAGKVDLTTWDIPGLADLPIDMAVEKAVIAAVGEAIKGMLTSNGIGNSIEKKMLRAVSDTLDHALRENMFVDLTVSDFSKGDMTPVVYIAIPFGEDDCSDIELKIPLAKLLDGLLEENDEDIELMMGVHATLKQHEAKWGAALAKMRKKEEAA